MYIHAVLFQIKAGEVADYRQDCKMWAMYAKKAAGFISYHTMQRDGQKDQYISVYKWKAKKYRDSFMNKYHEWLESKSKAKVKVIDYYNFKTLDNID